MSFFAEYGLFFAKTITIVIAIIAILVVIIALKAKSKAEEKGSLQIKKINEKYDEITEMVNGVIQSKSEKKAEKLKLKKTEKEKKSSVKKEKSADKKRLFVMNFDGDIKASAVDDLRETITAVLLTAKSDDHVLLCLESGGGMVNAYGLASSQLQRLRDASIYLTVAIDKVAASGGYMMACVADRIIASPFAILGSIGVVAQIPNFHRLLKKNDVDVEILTAGEHKRTLTMFGQNTDKAREKFVQDLEDTHELFKHYVSERRPVVDIEKVANGDIWFGTRAKEVALADELMTSDEYLCEACNRADVYSVEVKEKKTIADKLGIAASRGIELAVTRLLSMWNVTRGMK